MILHEHIPSGNSNIIENGIAVILILEERFRSNIASLDSFQCCKSILISDGN